MNLCRVCVLILRPDAGEYIFNENDSIADIMEELCGLEIAENDGLPDVVCYTCIKELKSAISLKQKCLASDVQLRKMLVATNTTLVENEDNDDTIPTITFKILYEEVIELLPEEIESTTNLATEEHESNEQVKEQSDAEAPFPEVAAEESELTLRCCGCESGFESKELLIKHSKTVHESQRTLNAERPFECGICYRRYMSERGLKLHRRSVYQLKFHQCSLCGKRFSSRAVLANHERSHTKLKPFFCNLCDKRFGSRSNLLSHSKLHSEASKHYCNLCGEGFNRKSYLKHHHSLLHSKETPFACTLCPSKFKAKANLRLHLRTHTQERPYSCELCEKSFMYPTDKKRHMIQHTGLKPFKCSDCDKAFTRNGLLQKHRACHEGGASEGACDA